MGLLFPWTTARVNWLPIQARLPRSLEYERGRGEILRGRGLFLLEMGRQQALSGLHELDGAANRFNCAR